MASRLIHQSRTVYVSQNVTSQNSFNFQRDFNIPFHVDEIRIGNAILTPGNFMRTGASTTVSQSVVVETPDLLGAIGTYLTSAPYSACAIAGNTGFFSTFAPIDHHSCEARYVYPPTQKRSINGTYRFAIMSPTRSPLVYGTDDVEKIGPFTIGFTIEFIQYSERDRTSEDVQSDFETIYKSGRRRL